MSVKFELSCTVCMHMNTLVTIYCRLSIIVTISVIVTHTFNISMKNLKENPIKHDFLCDYHVSLITL